MHSYFIFFFYHTFSFKNHFHMHEGASVFLFPCETEFFVIYSTAEVYTNGSWNMHLTIHAVFERETRFFFWMYCYSFPHLPIYIWILQKQWKDVSLYDRMQISLCLFRYWNGKVEMMSSGRVIGAQFWNAFRVPSADLYCAKYYTSGEPFPIFITENFVSKRSVFEKSLSNIFFFYS